MEDSPIPRLAQVPVESVAPPGDNHSLTVFLCWGASFGSVSIPDGLLPSFAPFCSLCLPVTLMDIDMVSCQMICL